VKIISFTEYCLAVEGHNFHSNSSPNICTIFFSKIFPSLSINFLFLFFFSSFFVELFSFSSLFVELFFAFSLLFVELFSFSSLFEELFSLIVVSITI